MTTETNRSALGIFVLGNVTLVAGLVATIVVAAGLVTPLSAFADDNHGTAPTMYTWFDSSYYPEDDYAWFDSSYYPEDDYAWYSSSYDYDEYYTYDDWYSYEDYYSYDDYSDYGYYDYDYSYYPYDYYSYDYYDYDYGCNSCSCSGGCDTGCHSGCTPHYEEPVCDISASDTSIEDGDDVTLHWTSEGATSASLSGYGSVSTGGSRTVSPDHDTTYTLTVHGNGGSETCSVRINVDENNNDLSCDLNVSDSRVDEGDEVRLTWDTEGADYASINQGIGRVDEDGGHEDVDVDDDTTFRMTVRNDDGDEETCSASVRVDDDNNFSSIRFEGEPTNNPPTVYLSQLPYTGLEDMTPGLIASWIMLAALLGIGGYFFFLKRRTA